MENRGKLREKFIERAKRESHHTECSLRSHKLRPFFHSFQTLWLSPLLVLALWKIGDEKYSIVLSFRNRQIPHTRVWFFNTMAKHSWRRVLKSAASSLLVSSSLLSLLWLNMLSISCKGLIYLADLKSNLGISQKISELVNAIDGFSLAICRVCAFPRIFPENFGSFWYTYILLMILLSFVLSLSWPLLEIFAFSKDFATLFQSVK